MSEIRVIKSHDDITEFERKCNLLLGNNYKLSSSSSAATGECQDIVYIAIFIKESQND